MAKVYLSAEPVARLAGVSVTESAASRSLSVEPGREGWLARLAGLAEGKAVFLPADPPRSGRVGVWAARGGGAGLRGGARGGGVRMGTGH
ncbi:hypothetical protein OV450_8372, partial [Actinobacteria bacterium OV450]